MKKSTFILFLTLSALVVSAQNKIINLEDIFKTRALFPSSLAQLAWQSNSQFTYVANQSLVSGNIKNAKADTLLNLKTLNEKLKKIKAEELKSFPRITWKDEKTFIFFSQLQSFSYDLKKKS